MIKVVSDLMVSVGLSIFLIFHIALNPKVNEHIKKVLFLLGFAFSIFIPLVLINIEGTPIIFYKVFMTSYIIGWSIILLYALSMILKSLGLIKKK